MKKNDGGLPYCGAENSSGPQQKRDVDAYLERLIEAQHVKMVGAPTAQERRDAWYSMKSLIECRSPVRIRRMEIDRGLSRRRARAI